MLKVVFGSHFESKRLVLYVIRKFRQLRLQRVLKVVFGSHFESKRLVLYVIRKKKVPTFASTASAKGCVWVSF